MMKLVTSLFERKLKGRRKSIFALLCTHKEATYPEVTQAVLKSFSCLKGVQTLAQQPSGLIMGPVSQEEVPGCGGHVTSHEHTPKVSSGLWNVQTSPALSSITLP
jgi:hypothetical protein